MIQRLLSLNNHSYKTVMVSTALAGSILITSMPINAAPTVSTQAEAPVGIAAALIAADSDSAQATNPAADATTAAKPATDISNTLAAQLQPSNKALSAANQELLSRNAQLQRQVNDLQTQANVLVYESKGQLFLYGAFTVLISLLVGIFISWLVFVRRERW